MVLYIENGQSYFDSRLLNSIKVKNTSEITEMLKNISNPGYLVDSTRRTLLHYAAESNHLYFALSLIELGTLLDAQDCQGKTALMLTSCREFIERLLKHNANINICDKSGKSALQTLMETGHFPQILYRRLNNEYHGNIDKITEILIESKCFVRMVLSLKNPQLTRSLLERNCPLVKLDNNELSHEPDDIILEAIRLDDIENLRVLLNYGVDPNAADSKGKTPMYYYGWSNLDDNPEFLRLLLDHGANPNMILNRNSEDNCYGYMQMYSLLIYCNRDIINILLQYNVDLDATDLFGETAIHYIAHNEYPDVHEELRGRKFNVNARDNINRTPLHNISIDGLSMARFFIDMGADVDVSDDDGCTPLMILCEYYPFSPETKRFVELFLRHGADPQIENWNGQCFLINDGPIGSELSMMDLVLAHLVVIEAQGSTIKEFVKNQIDENASATSYFEMCKNQAEKMKQVKVSKSVTLYEFLVANDDKMKRLVRNKTALMNLRQMRNKNEYLPYYQYLVRDRALKALKIVNMRKEAAADLFEAISLKHNAFQMISEKIISYLTDSDLREMYRLN